MGRLIATPFSYHELYRLGITDFVLINKIDQFKAGDILYMHDRGFLKNTTIHEILEARGVPDAIINNTLSQCFFDNPHIKCYGISTKANSTGYEDLPVSVELETTHACNFIINRVGINRILTLRLCEMHKLDPAYIWSGVGRTQSMSTFIRELHKKKDYSSWLTTEQRSFFLAPTQIKKQWPFNDFADLDPLNFPAGDLNLDSLPHRGNNQWFWEKHAEKILSKGAVSLIAEGPESYSTHFTWKTSYAMLGLSFPIWVGGFQQADQWSSYGFDVFHDVIDHSYQNYSTITEQCWWAFKLNLHLLTDRKLAAEIRIKHKDRLIENRRKFINKEFEKNAWNKIQLWPDNVRSVGERLYNSGWIHNSY